MDFQFEEPIRPDSKLSDFLGWVVAVKAVSKEFTTSVPDSADRPGFTSQAVLVRILGYNPSNGQVKTGYTNLFPPALRQEALRVSPKYTKPGLLAKIAHTDSDKAANGFTVWTTQPVEDKLLQAAVAAFQKA